MQFKWMNESRLSESENRLELYAPRIPTSFAAAKARERRALRPSHSATRPIITRN